MCGIVGIFIKNKKLEKYLGNYLSVMIDGMSSRGPDSAGFAIYESVSNNSLYKISLCITDEIHYDIFKKNIKKKFKDIKFKQLADHLIISTSSKPNTFIKYIEKNYPSISIVGFGKSIEIFRGFSAQIIVALIVSSVKNSGAISMVS